MSCLTGTLFGMLLKVKACAPQVRRSYDKQRKHKNRGAKRAWKLKRMIIEQNLEDTTAVPTKKRGDKGGDRTADDMERFMQVGVNQEHCYYDHACAQACVGTCAHAACGHMRGGRPLTVHAVCDANCCAVCWSVWQLAFCHQNVTVVPSASKEGI